MSPSLDSLEVEVLAMILEYVDDATPHTTKSVSRTCRHLNLTSKLVSNRRKSLDFTAGLVPTAHKKIEQWSDQPLLLKGLRHLTIKASGIWSFEPGSTRLEDRWAPLVLLLKKLTNLKTLVWSLQELIPLPVLDTLHTCQPRAVLKVYAFTRVWGRGCSMDSTETALARSPALVLLRMNTSRAGTGPLEDVVDGELHRPCLQRPEAVIWLAVFQKIVATAPNLHTVSAITPYMVPEDLTALNKVTALLALGEKPNGAVRSLTLDGFGYSKATLEHWGHVIALSTVESLKCSRGAPCLDYFAAASASLPNLKQVSLNLSYDIHLGLDRPSLRAALTDYLSSCAPLETLSLWSWIDVVSLNTILDRHGSSLKNLQLHEREEIGMLSAACQCHRTVLSIDQITSVRQKCPHLTELTVDINRQSPALDEEASNIAIYQELSQIQHLNKVQLYFDLGINGTTPLRSSKWNDANFPRFTPCSSTEIDRHARDIWHIVHGSRTKGERRLDVKMGEWERRHGPVTWESDTKSWWVILPHHRDDREGTPMVQIHGRPLAPNDSRYADHGLRHGPPSSDGEEDAD